jgi:hypothetical protein
MNFIKFLFVFLLSYSSLYSWSDITGGRGDFVTDSTFHLLYGGSGTAVLGDFNATGDSILYVDDGSTPNLISSHTSYKNVDTTFNNTAYSLGDAEKMNSSSATLNLPSFVQGKDIVWAGLFWQGHIYRGSGTYSDSQVDSAAANWNTVTLKDSLGNMHTVTAPLNDNDLTHKAFHYAMHASNGGFRYQYGAYCEVTDIVKNSYSSTNKTFIVGNLKTTAGLDTGGYQYIAQAPAYSGSFRFGLYGGWTLIVVYDVDSATAFANNVSAKNVTLYDGFDLYLTWGVGTVPFSTTLTLSGFYTPKSGSVDSKLLLFGGAGDKGIEDDTLQLQDGKNTGSFLDISNSPNQAGRQFNHTYTYLANHMTPTSTNKQGMDLDIYDVSDKIDNGQSSTQIKFGVVKSGSHCDQIFPQVIGFSTTLYEPSFCYDYAYEQQSVFFTEDNDGTQDPKIVGDVLTTEPVKVKVFVRNLVDSDLAIEDMNVSILDINTSQLTYIRNTTELATSAQMIPTAVDDSTLIVSDSYIQDVDVGSMSSNDYFYIYYQLDPSQTSLDSALNVRANYNLRVNSTTTIPYNLTLGANVPLCSSTNFEYKPDKGLFNIVNDTFNIINPRSSGYYNNLPTAVTQRPDNYTVLSYDANDTDLNTLKDANISVFVEIIDASAFHDTFASCKEEASSVSDKILVVFENSPTTPFTAQDIIDAALTQDSTGSNPDAAKEFYDIARENAAFRISWATDYNGSNVGVEGNESTGYHLTNFSDYATISCAQPVTVDVETGSSGNYVTKTFTQVPQACYNAGTSSSSAMNKKELAACFKCIYGYNTHFVCSRDNFSIRPEAFLMHLDDQNQTDPTSQIKLTTNQSGVVGATTSILDLAAGYKYDLEVNATNHYTNAPSPGYTKTMNITSDDTALYLWKPRSGVIYGACNDEGNQTAETLHNMRFVDGIADRNSSVAQVGEYTLNIQDTTWTSVDGIASNMTHHNTGDSYYKTTTETLDCVTGSDTVPTVGSRSLVGCNISSNHLNLNNNIQYNDYDVTFHPYKFSIGNTLTVGDENKTVAQKPFVYMANIDSHEGVSVHLNTTVSAIGYDGSGVSNFVTGCFAKDTLFGVGKSPTNDTKVSYRYLAHDLNSSGSRISGLDINGTIAAGDVNASPLMTIPSTFWQKNQNGSLSLLTNLNFNRDKNISVNPENINYTILDSNDTTNIFNADLVNNKYAEGNLTVGQKVMHYYGKTHAPKLTVACESSPCSTGVGNNLYNAQELIYFVVYCNPTEVTCSTATNLPAGSVQTNDIRWWTNTYHDVNVTQYIDGIIGNISEVAATGHVDENASARAQVTTYKYDSIITYDGNYSYPYDAIMQMQSSDWLIYDKDDNTSTTNKFTIEFIGNSDWSGKHEEDTTTNVIGIPTTKGRVSW